MANLKNTLSNLIDQYKLEQLMQPQEALNTNVSSAIQSAINEPNSPMFEIKDRPEGDSRVGTTNPTNNFALTWNRSDPNITNAALKYNYQTPNGREFNMEGDKNKNYSIGTESNGIETTLNHSPGYWGLGLKLTPQEIKNNKLIDLLKQ